MTEQVSGTTCAFYEVVMLECSIQCTVPVFSGGFSSKMSRCSLFSPPHWRLSSPSGLRDLTGGVDGERGTHGEFISRSETTREWVGRPPRSVLYPITTDISAWLYAIESVLDNAGKLCQVSLELPDVLAAFPGTLTQNQASVLWGGGGQRPLISLYIYSQFMVQSERHQGYRTNNAYVVNKWWPSRSFHATDVLVSLDLSNPIDSINRLFARPSATQTRP
ncbi:hypothetical protein B0H14DRAFT_2579302 [Mycena olivaceomarginata]|nr:hypothetical protein B0H14DRAFT_2579302 [Mycena olivaceomarginata]